MHTPHLSFAGDAVSWQNLPLLNATVIYDGDEIFPSKEEINFLSITVESIYNPPVSFAEDADYKAGTIMYTDNEVPHTFADRSRMEISLEISLEIYDTFYRSSRKT